MRMIRFFFRFAGFWLLAGGFVAAVVDGTRSIAASRLRMTTVAEAWSVLGPLVFDHPQTESMPWIVLAAPLLALPVSVPLLVVGLMLLSLGRAREHSRFQVG